MYRVNKFEIAFTNFSAGLIVQMDLDLWAWLEVFFYLNQSTSRLRYLLVLSYLKHATALLLHIITVFSIVLNTYTWNFALL